MCSPTTDDKTPKTPESTKRSAATQRRDDSVRNLNNSAAFKDVEMGPLVQSGSQDSLSSSESTAGSQASAFSWLSLKALTNGKVFSACAMYCFCSVSMVLVNKSLASSYNHLIETDLNILIVVFQAIVAVVCVEGCKYMKWVEYPSFDIATAKQWAPVNIFFCMMLFTGMAALQYNSVPMVTIFKNVTNIITTAGDWYCFGSYTEGLVIVAFGIMLTGAIAAAWNDIEVTMVGLFWMALNCITTAGYVLYMKFATKNVKLSTFGMVFYNNLLCIFFLLPVAYFMGQLNVFVTTPALHTTDYFTKNFFAGFVGFFLNFASLNCVGVTGPTTYAIIGSLNKIPVAFLGYFMFDNIITKETWFFISVSMAGGFLYSYAKIQTSRRKQPRSGK